MTEEGAACAPRTESASPSLEVPSPAWILGSAPSQQASEPHVPTTGRCCALRAVAPVSCFARKHTLRVYPGRMPDPMSPGPICSPKSPNTNGLRPEEEEG